MSERTDSADRCCVAATWMLTLTRRVGADLVLVQAGQENDCDAYNVVLGQLVWVWSICLQQKIALLSASLFKQGALFLLRE